MRIFLLKILVVGAMTAFFAGTASSDEGDNAPKAPEVIELVTGDVQTVETKNLSRVSVANPDVADISDAQPNKVLVVGKKAGQTEVSIWDDNGKKSVIVRVAGENLDSLKTRLEAIINKTGIKGISLDKSAYEGKVVLSGSVYKEDKDVLDKVTDPFSDRIINLVKKEVSEDLVQIDMQVTELSTTLTKSIGIDWNRGGASGATTGATGVSTTSGTPFLNLDYKETLPSTNGKPEDFFKIGDFNRTSSILATVNALLQEGKGRILSKPRLVVLSGKEASFLVGGEIPVVTTTTTGGGAGTTTSNVSFKQYGVNMTITPTVRDGKIDILLNVQISDIDRANKVGNDVAFITRSAQTQLFLDNSQTIVLAGLIKHADGQTIKGIPFLSKIPVVGMFFRTRQNGAPDSDTELVISLTPTILKSKKMATEQVVLPTKRMDSFAKEIESNFEKEPLNPPLEKKLPMAPPAKGASQPMMIKPISQVPDIIVSLYVRSIQLRISQAVSYPYEALQKNWQGAVKLRLRILKDGTLADADVLESSGHDVFDKDALNTAKTAAPFAPFPKEMKGEDIVVTVPIVYNQHTASQNDTQTVVAAY
ncbi:MAG: TonB family protein [Candidatus Omnitrophica bacterium]|nr:TonB family protein [Candidatus Omnitrophota bacterium]